MWEWHWFEPFGSLVAFLSFSTRIVEQYTIGVNQSISTHLLTKIFSATRSYCMPLVILSHISTAVEGSSLHNLTISHQLAHLMGL